MDARADAKAIREAGHDWVHGRDERGRTLATICSALVWCAVAWLFLFCCGCTIPQGTHAQTAGIGIDLEPFGSSQRAPRARIGSFASQWSTPVPADAGPSLNRTDLEGPLGVKQTSTEAIGPVGAQVREGGDTLAKTVNALHPASQRGPLIPFELPRPAAPAEPKPAGP